MEFRPVAAAALKDKTPTDNMQNKARNISAPFHDQSDTIT
jgi:hypothetical protein